MQFLFEHDPYELLQHFKYIRMFLRQNRRWGCCCLLPGALSAIVRPLRSYPPMGPTTSSRWLHSDRKLHRGACPMRCVRIRDTRPSRRSTRLLFTRKRCPTDDAVRWERICLHAWRYVLLSSIRSRSPRETRERTSDPRTAAVLNLGYCDATALGSDPGVT